MRSRIDIVAYALCAAFVVSLLVFGWKVHIIETAGAEADGYFKKAEEFMSGRIPRDPYRPLLYPALSAAVGIVVGDAFTGARTVTTFLAGLFLLAAYLLGRSCFGRRVSLFALVALMLNYNVITAGVEAATDMPFSALVLLTLFFALRLLNGRPPRFAELVLLAFSFALAYCTRYQALVLIPVIAVALFISLAGTGSRSKTVAVAVFTCAVLLFLTPHFVVTSKLFGSPLHNENWKNLAFKVHGSSDWAYFRRVPFDGWFSVVLSGPVKILSQFVRELGRFFYVTIGALGGQGLAGSLFSVLALVGLYRDLWTFDRKKVVLVTFVAVLVLSTCFFFYSLPRLVLPILPLGYLWAGSFLLSGPFAGSFHVARVRVSRSAPLVAVFMIALLASTVVHMRMYVAAHPVAELEAARAIERKCGSDVTVLGTFPFMQRYVTYTYRWLDNATDEESGRSELYMARMKAIVGEADADFVIVGRLFLEKRPVELLTGADTEGFLEPVYRTADVVVYRVVKEGTRCGEGEGSTPFDPW